MAPSGTREPSRVVRTLAVCGFGRAGRARVREIEAHEDLELAGVVTRSEATGRRSLEDVLADPRVDALVVCTENARHAEIVRAGIEAAKHVLVEFPLCLSSREALELVALARERAVTLHVEHIELLTRAHAERREKLASMGRILEAEVTFRGGASGWIVDPLLGGSPAHTGIARLHVQLDLFGPLALRSASLRELEGGRELVVEWEATRGSHPVRWVERRQEGAGRSTDVRVVSELSELPTPSPSREPENLFRRDLLLFLENVRSGRSLAEELEREIVALRLADEVANRVR